MWQLCFWLFFGLFLIWYSLCRWVRRIERGHADQVDSKELNLTSSFVWLETDFIGCHSQKVALQKQSAMCGNLWNIQEQLSSVIMSYVLYGNKENSCLWVVATLQHSKHFLGSRPEVVSRPFQEFLNALPLNSSMRSLISLISLHLYIYIPHSYESNFFFTAHNHVFQQQRNNKRFHRSRQFRPKAWSDDGYYQSVH